MKLTTGLRNFCLDSGLQTAFDTDGVLEIRTGSAPAAAGDALSGTVLSAITLPADAFAAAASGAVAKNGTWQDVSADAAGTAGYAVLRKSGDTANADDTVRRMILTVSASGGGGELQLDNTNINTGQQVTITSFSVTQPAT